MDEAIKIPTSKPINDDVLTTEHLIVTSHSLFHFRQLASDALNLALHLVHSAESL